MWGNVHNTLLNERGKLSDFITCDPQMRKDVQVYTKDAQIL